MSLRRRRCFLAGRRPAVSAVAAAAIATSTLAPTVTATALASPTVARNTTAAARLRHHHVRVRGRELAHF